LLFLSTRRRRSELLSGDVSEGEEAFGVVGDSRVGFVLLWRIDGLGETVCGVTARVELDCVCVLTDGCPDLDTKSRCRVARRSVSEFRRILGPDDVVGVRTVGLLACGVPMRVPTLLVELDVVFCDRFGRNVMLRVDMPDRDCPIMVPPNRDDGLLDLVLDDGVWLEGPVMVKERDGVVVRLRMLGAEGRAGWIERFDVVGVLRVVIRRSEELPMELLGVDETLGARVDEVLGVELGRRLRIEKPPLLVRKELLPMLGLGRDGRLDRVLSDRLPMDIRLDDELRMDGLEILG
jgi:hypothetical protein